MLLAVANGNDDSIVLERVGKGRVRLSFLGPRYGRKPIVTLNQAELTYLAAMIDEARDAKPGVSLREPLNAWVSARVDRRNDDIWVILRRCNQTQDRCVKVADPLLGLFCGAFERAAAQA